MALGLLRQALPATLAAVPLALLLIFMLLYSAFGSARLAALVYLNVPLAVTGGVVALAAAEAEAKEAARIKEEEELAAKDPEFEPPNDRIET